MPATDAASSILVNQVLRIISPTYSHSEAISSFLGFLLQSPRGRYWGFSLRQRQCGFVHHLLQRKAGADFLDARNGCELFQNKALQHRDIGHRDTDEVVGI